MRKRTHGQTKAARAKTQAKYNSKPEQIKRRSERNKSRAIMIKKGLARKGDGRDVDHKNHKTSDMEDGNLRVISKSKNRSGGGPRPKKKR